MALRDRIDSILDRLFERYFDRLITRLDVADIGFDVRSAAEINRKGVNLFRGILPVVNVDPTTDPMNLIAPATNAPDVTDRVARNLGRLQTQQGAQVLQIVRGFTAGRAAGGLGAGVSRVTLRTAPANVLLTEFSFGNSNDGDAGTHNIEDISPTGIDFVLANNARNRTENLHVVNGIGISVSAANGNPGTLGYTGRDYE